MERFPGTPDKIQETCFKTTVFKTKKKDFNSHTVGMDL